MYGDIEYQHSENYFANHWRGNHSLALSYWINGGLISTIISTISIGFSEAIVTENSSLQAVSIVSILLVLLSLIVSTWGMVGVWRSASFSPDRGGSSFWAVTAKVMVVIATISILIQVAIFSRVLLENTQLAVGHDSLGDPATLQVDGDTLKLSGMLTLGTAEAFEKILRSNSQISKVSLISPGGRIHEASMISRLVQAAGLDTQIDGICASACTMVYFAGYEKILGHGGLLGFHSSSLPGISDEEARQSNSDMKRAYVRAGLPTDFITKAIETRSSQMWYPTVRELIAAHALDRMTPEFVAADHVESAESLNKQAPLFIDEVTILQSVKADGQRLTYRYSLNPRVIMAANKVNFRILKENNKREICSDPGAQLLVKSGANFGFVYTDIAGAVVGSFRVETCD